MNQETQAEPSAVAAAHGLGTQLSLRSVEDRRDARVPTSACSASPLRSSDAERYHWIRANRGNFAITDALSHADRDADFDARIDAAIRISATGRNFYACLDDLSRGRPKTGGEGTPETI